VPLSGLRIGTSATFSSTFVVGPSQVPQLPQNLDGSLTPGATAAVVIGTAAFLSIVVTFHWWQPALSLFWGWIRCLPAPAPNRGGSGGSSLNNCADLDLTVARCHALCRTSTTAGGHQGTDGPAMNPVATDRRDSFWSADASSTLHGFVPADSDLGLVSRGFIHAL